MFRFFLLAALFLVQALPAQADPRDDIARLREFAAEVVKAGEIADEAIRGEKIKAEFGKIGPLAAKLADPKEAELLIKAAGLGNFLTFNSQASLFQNPALAPYLSALKSKPTAAAASKIFEKIAPQEFLALSKLIDFGIANAEISKFKALGLVLEDLKTMDLPGFSPADVDFFSHAFLQYFDELSISKRRRILSAWLRLPPKAPLEKQLGVILKNSGPALQKIFQLVGKKSNNPKVKLIMEELLSGIPPMPFEEVKEIVERNSGKPISEVFTKFNRKASGAGTIGQVHSAYINGQKVAVKVLRTGIEEEMEADLKVLAKVIAGNAAAADMVAKVSPGFQRETHLNFEAENLTKLGPLYEDNKLGIAVPHLIGSVKPTQQVLVTSWAEGVELDKADELDPKIRGKAVMNLLQKCFGVAMYGPGDFHSDLHAGNGKLLIVVKKPGFKVTVLDFGAVSRLSIDQRRNLLMLAFSVWEENPEKIVHGLGSISPISEKMEGKIIKDIESVLSVKASPEEQLNLILGSAVKNGVSVDPEIVMFSRAIEFMSDDLKEINHDLLLKYPGARPFKPFDVYVKATINNVPGAVKAYFSHDGEKIVWNHDVLESFFASAKAKLSLKLQECEEWFLNLNHEH